MTRAGIAASVLWAVVAALALAIVTQARYAADLSAFLPRAPTPTQQLLVDQLRDGVASRLLIVAVSGSDPQARAALSTRMGALLRADADFTSVTNGESATLERDREFLLTHRYALSSAVRPARFTATGMTAAIQETLDLLASPAGLLAKPLLLRDPTGEMLQILDRLGGGAQPRMVEGVWASQDGERAMLVLQTRATGSDTDGQQRAIDAIQRAFDAALATLPPSADRNAALELTGTGAFAVAARATIEREALRLTLLSSALIMLLLLAVYRSVKAVALGLVPVISGALAGVAAVALGFGVVHGITLGFGITLIGESVDYSIYLFIQSRAGAHGSAADRAQWRRALWPTIRLGVLTSIFGFASLLPSGFPGLAQLGLFSITGLAVAALVTRYVLPHWLPQNFVIQDLAPLGVGAGRLLEKVAVFRPLLAAVPVAVAIVLYLHWGSLWNRELAALSPVSAAEQARDARLRADIGGPDVRYLVVASAAERESALRSAEAAAERLQPLVDSGALGGYDSPATYLPSDATQRERQASLPDRTQLLQTLEEAVVGLPVRADRLAPFIDDVDAARTRPLLTRADLEGTSLATPVDALLSGDARGWTAVLPLRAEIDIAQVRAALSGAQGVTVLDLKGEADGLYSNYLAEVVRLSLAGLAAIVLLLLVTLRSPMRVLRVVTPLVLAVLTVTAGLALLGHTLTILHVIGMLLIFAVGSNYALFFDRRSTDLHAAAVPLTLASLVIANLATVVGFGVLATSSVPVLNALGSTVAPGALLAFLFSALLAQRAPQAVRPAG